MHSVQYGNQLIEYTVQERPDLPAYYLSVSRDEGVVLKGPGLASTETDQLVLKKARWILAKLSLVHTHNDGDIVTGSRIAYLGRHYYAEVVSTPDLSQVQIDFNHSRFRILVNPNSDSQADIEQGLTEFFRTKATEKITPRVRYWSKMTGLTYTDLKFRQMTRRWGSCTPSDAIILNTDVVKLPFTLIDYVIVHELCHTKIKSHSSEFWTELARHLPEWKILDDRINHYKL